MPIVTRKEFAELCGFPDAMQLNVFISRRNVSHLPDNKKLLDTDDPINALFIEAKKAQNAAKLQAVATQDVSVIPKSKRVNKPKTGVQPKEVQQKDKQIVEQLQKNQARVDQDMQKKALEIENLELAKQQKLLALNKAAGQLIPVDLVKGVLKRHSDSIIKSFERGIETLLTIIVQTTSGGDPKVHGKFLGMAKKTLSDCIVAAGEMSEEEITILVDEFSQQLNRGQRRV
jgi:hypothetical protein